MPQALNPSRPLLLLSCVQVLAPEATATGPPADCVYTKNRDRLLNDDVMGLFVEKLMGAPEVNPLLSDDPFSVDGTLLQAWASHASLKQIDGQEDPPPPPTGPGEGFGAPKEGKKRANGDFRGIKLSNETHRSSTDPEALLARKSNAHPAQLSYRGHVLMDNRHDLIVDCRVTQATGTGERDAAKEMAADLSSAHQKTIGADKKYDTKSMAAPPVTWATPSRSMPAGGSKRCLVGSKRSLLRRSSP